MTSNIEAPRLRQEERLEDLGFEMVEELWYNRGKRTTPLLANKRIGQDGPGNGVTLSSDLQQLRSVLQAEEVVRLRHASTLAAEIMDEVIRSVRPGISEYEVAARVAAASYKRGGNAVVNLVASDERIYDYRHPLPTNKAVRHYAEIVLCLRYRGVTPSITRLIHFGPLLWWPYDGCHLSGFPSSWVSLLTMVGCVTSAHMFSLMSTPMPQRFLCFVRKV